MKLGLINSAWAQAGRDTAYGLRKTRELGFDTVDIFADPLDTSAAERAMIRSTCDDLDLPIVSVACVALGLIDFNPSVRRFHIDRCKQYLEMTAEFGGRNLLLVLGEYVWQREVEPFRESLLNDVPKMKKFLDDVASPSVKANLDISHLVLANQGPELLESLRGQIGHIHISDCDGKVHGDLPPGRGVVNFVPYLAKISDLGLNQDDVVMSIELEYSPEPDKIEAWVAEAYESTAQLLRNANLRD